MRAAETPLARPVVGFLVMNSTRLAWTRNRQLKVFPLLQGHQGGLHRSNFAQAWGWLGTFLGLLVEVHGHRQRQVGRWLQRAAGRLRWDVGGWRRLNFHLSAHQLNPVELLDGLVGGQVVLVGDEGVASGQPLASVIVRVHEVEANDPSEGFHNLEKLKFCHSGIQVPNPDGGPIGRRGPRCARPHLGHGDVACNT